MKRLGAALFIMNNFVVFSGQTIAESVRWLPLESNFNPAPSNGAWSNFNGKAPVLLRLQGPCPCPAPEALLGSKRLRVSPQTAIKTPGNVLPFFPFSEHHWSNHNTHQPMTSLLSVDPSDLPSLSNTLASLTSYILEAGVQIPSNFRLRTRN